MEGLVVWAIFLIQVFILIIIGLKRGFAKSLISFIVNVLNITIAFIVSRIFVNAMVEKVSKHMVEVFNSEYSVDLKNIAVIETFSRFVSSVILAIVEFFIIYIILFIINTIIKKIVLYKKLNDKIKCESKIATIGISVVSAMLTFMVFVTPVGVAYNSLIPAVSNERASKIPLASKYFFDKLTEMPNNENNIKASNEVEYAVNAVVAANNIINGNNFENNNVKLFRNNFEKSYFLPTVIAEFGATAAKQWKNGDEFLGERADNLEGREGELTIRFLDILEKWNKQYVVDDVNTILDLANVFKKYEIDKTSEGNKLLNALADEKFTEDIFAILCKNKDFASMIPAFLEYGIGTAFDSIDINMKEKYISKVDASKLSEEDARREGRIMAGIIKSVLELSEIKDKIESGQITEEDLQGIVDAVSRLKDSKIFGDIADEIIYQISVNISDNI